MDGDDLPDLIARAKRGDGPAATALLQRFEAEIRVMVRTRLPRALRSKYDSMDFVQKVWTSVFTKGSSELADFRDDHHFLAFLAGVARNKVFEEHRRQTRTQKYDVGKEKPLYVRRGNRDLPRDVPASGPSPSQDAQAGDRLAQILDGRGAVERAVVHLRREGLTFQEIADETGLHEGAVRRMIEAMRERLEAKGWR